ncbi:MAG: hypothetical protein H7250_12375 [Flavobacterium sp.]|nr:hypothetical protein [Flavobacterium sp.]
MIIITSKYLIRNGIRGLTLFPFILVSEKADLKDEKLINHEKIHIQQQKELLILPFYFWYFIDFVIQFFKFKNKNSAYRNICFEKEAYANEKNLNYLKQRKFWNFLKYITL